MATPSLADQVAAYSRLAVMDSAKSFKGYLSYVTIDALPQPRPFRDVAGQWQWDLAARYDSCLEFVAGVRRERPQGPNRFFYVLPRGHDKTTAIGRALNWALGFARRSFKAVVAAADTEQAGLIKDAMEAEARLNPWLGERLIFDKTKVVGQHDSKLRIMAADAAGSWGLQNVDLFVIDELTWWKTAPGVGGNRFWDAISSAFHKRNALVLIISNAGELDSWQHKVWAAAQASPELWTTWSAPEEVCLATWLSPETRALDRKLVPPSVGDRVFGNKWIDPAVAGGYISRTEAEACHDPTLPLFVFGPELGCSYWASIDYGPKRDRTALGLGHLDVPMGRVVVDRLDVWQGSPQSPIQVAAVDAWVDEVVSRYHADLIFDPYQMEGLAQKWEHRIVVERFEARGGKANYELAECLRSLVINRQIAWHPAAGQLTLADGSTETLASELGRLIIKLTEYGYRFDHTSGRHDDRAVAVGMMALAILKDKTSGRWIPPVKVTQQHSVPSHVVPANRFVLNIPRQTTKLYGIKPGRRFS